MRSPLVLGHEIGGALQSTKKKDSNAFYLAKASMIVRREVLQVENCFDGAVAANCQADSVPTSMVTLLDMIVRCPRIKPDSIENQACHTIAQLIVYNSVC